MDALYRHILDHLETAVVLLDGDLRVRFLNHAAEFMLAASNERSLGDTLSHVLRGDDDFEDELVRALASMQPYTRRQIGLHAPVPKQDIVVDLTVTPMADCDYHGLLVEMQPLERQLRINREESQKRIQQTTRQLVRGLAHEIKNPLGGIRGAAQLLARELDKPNLRDYTDIVIEEADRLRNLVDRMLGPNQLPKLAPTNVHRLLERVRQLIEAEYGPELRIERDYDPSIPEVVSDAEQLIQALLNVVNNAAQAVEDTEGATIILRTRTVRQFTINNARHRLAIRIDIIDNGPGITAELADRLFYPMISGRPGGTGLGLSIAQSIVSQHGGTMEYESEPGATRFTLFLPLEPSDEAA
ncbi:MAG: nitrogen regulation protein NR(II) [Pseudomonadales bacterium]|jgi:two-component system nitrogen regulation sensor histidine kinase GlnL|nr:nitrogen regulation protein NR(II) [Pseudomonadales bacterium]